MNDERPEKIVSVAIWHGGLVFSLPAPNRHCHVLNTMHVLGVKQDHTTEQGFLTDTGDFVRRKPALLIAKAAGQMKRLQGPGTYQGDELFSEDLW